MKQRARNGTLEEMEYFIDQADRKEWNGVVNPPTPRFYPITFKIRGALQNNQEDRHIPSQGLLRKCKRSESIAAENSGYV